MVPSRTRSVGVQWADGADREQELAKWCKAQSSWDLKVMEHPSGSLGFCIQLHRTPRRMIVVISVASEQALR